MQYHQGKFTPKNPNKYMGDSTNIIYRSGWEKKAMIFFDMNANILKWASEEIAIPYISPIDNRIHRYFPDFVVVAKDNSNKINKYLVEVKPKKQTVPPIQKKRQTKSFLNEVITYEINKAKWKAAEHFCNKQNMSFLILTEDQIKP